MSVKRKSLLALVVLVLLILALLPFTLHRALLTYAKYSARSTFKNLTPIELRNLDLLPTPIALPTPSSASPRDSAQVGDYLVHFPIPVEKTQKPHSLTLVYPTFRIVLLEPFSTEQVDAVMKSSGATDLRGDAVSVSHARLADIDSCTSSADFKKIVDFLKRKSTTFDLAACFEEFSQLDRWGSIRATDAGLAKLHVELYFPLSHIGCGFYVDTPSKTPVPIADLHQFVACLTIEAVPPATSRPKN